MIRRLLCVATAALAAITLAPATAAATTHRPVVIVAGTFGPAFFYEPLAARLRASGRQVAIFQLTDLGTADIRISARDLNTFADRFRASTGAAKVDLVGHSQGGLVARHYVKSLGGAAEVGSVVTLGTPNYGTVLANLAAFFPNGVCGVSCPQMAVGSDFLATLNTGDDTIGSVRYTNLFTAYDELVQPVWNAAMHDGATNVLIQSQCPLRFVEHIGLATDGTVYDGVRDALNLEPVRLNCFAI